MDENEKKEMSESMNAAYEEVLQHFGVGDASDISVDNIEIIGETEDGSPVLQVKLNVLMVCTDEALEKFASISEEIMGTTEDNE